MERRVLRGRLRLLFDLAQEIGALESTRIVEVDYARVKGIESRAHLVVEVGSLVGGREGEGGIERASS